ncbi:heat shock transcription factor 1 [Phyllostomus discolor]|uniref:Heat shock transcription factor 1 n=1 Tax=Phyllostomus discolor TaxID=89673 RepID=A0A833ZUX0_9CHIR|nr:heat shock transcription factor 1 [Phyllostomus discolor]
MAQATIPTVAGHPRSVHAHAPPLWLPAGRAVATGEASGWGCLGQGLDCPPPLARAELSEHLDAMDSNLDNLQTVLTSHGFSVDTTALLDVRRAPPPAPALPRCRAPPDCPPLSQLFSPSVPDMNLPDLDSSLASIQELLSPQEPPKPLEAEDSSPDSGKQLVHYTAQPLFLMEPGPVDMGSSDLPVLFELGEGPYFSEGDDGADDPTISLLTGSEPPKAKDPTVS